MAASTVLEKLRKLDDERNKLIDEAKTAALATAQAAIDELNELGFNYRLVEGDKATRTVSTGTRRAGIRDQVYDAVKGFRADGVNRADLLTMLGVKGDKAGEQSVSNALSALVKATKIGLANGKYTAV